jgi:hypothetical protein
MVPVMALEATTLTFVGHSWGAFRSSIGASAHGLKPQATSHQVWRVVRWAMYSVVIVLLVEIPLCLLSSFLGAKPFSQYPSGSEAVSVIAARMWRTIDWCCIMYALLTQLAAVLVSTRLE